MFNFVLYTVNSDIVTTVRLIFFRWVPSTALVVPVIGSILEAPASANILSHFNFQLQGNYVILYERQLQCAGIPLAPTVSSNFGATGLSIPLKGSSSLDYSLGGTNGTNQIYLLALSDSQLTPFPLLNFSSRLYFEDTVRVKVNKMVK